MLFYFAVALLLSASVASGSQYGDYVLQEYAPAFDNYEKTDYKFNYGVSDPHTGDHKQQWEVREKGIVRGSYSLLEPDGTTRIVDYIADDNGFRAVVKKIGESIHPTAEHHGFATSSSSVVQGAIEGHGVVQGHGLVEGHAVVQGTPIHVEQHVVAQPQLVVAQGHGYAEQHAHVQPQVVASHGLVQEGQIHAQVIDEGHVGYVTPSVQVQQVEGHQQVQNQVVVSEHGEKHRVLTEEEFAQLVKETQGGHVQQIEQHVQPQIVQQAVQQAYVVPQQVAHVAEQQKVVYQQAPQQVVQQSYVVPQQVAHVAEQQKVVYQQAPQQHVVHQQVVAENVGWQQQAQLQSQVVSEGHVGYASPQQNIQVQQVEGLPVKSIQEYVQNSQDSQQHVQPIEIVQRPIAVAQQIQDGGKQALFIHESQLSGGIAQAVHGAQERRPYYQIRNPGFLYDTTSGSYGGEVKNYLNSKLVVSSPATYNLAQGGGEIVSKEVYGQGNKGSVQILNSGNVGGGEIVSQQVHGYQGGNVAQVDYSNSNGYQGGNVGSVAYSNGNGYQGTVENVAYSNGNGYEASNGANAVYSNTNGYQGNGEYQVSGGYRLDGGYQGGSSASSSNVQSVNSGSLGGVNGVYGNQGYASGYAQGGSGQLISGNTKYGPIASEQIYGVAGNADYKATSGNFANGRQSSYATNIGHGHHGSSYSNMYKVEHH